MDFDGYKSVPCKGNVEFFELSNNPRQKRETRLELATSTLGRLHSTTELLPQNKQNYQLQLILKWSGRRGSNSQQLAWKARTLPIELRPHLHLVIPKNLHQNKLFFKYGILTIC